MFIEFLVCIRELAKKAIIIKLTSSKVNKNETMLITQVKVNKRTNKLFKRKNESVFVFKLTEVWFLYTKKTDNNIT